MRHGTASSAWLWPLVSGGVFTALTLAADRPVLRRVDSWLAQRVTRLGRTRLNPLAIAFQYLGAVEVVGLAALLEAIIRWRRGGGWRSVEPLGFLATIPLEFALKRLRHHPGPAGRRGPSAPTYLFLSVTTTNSFPSGHSCRLAFVAARLSVRPVRPPFRGLLWILVAGAVWSRLYLEEHWPSDVIGGLALGSLTGCLAARWGLRSRQRRDPTRIIQLESPGRGGLPAGLDQIPARRPRRRR